MKPQKIENLEQRLNKWHEQRRIWLLQELPMILIIGIIVCSGFMYLGSFTEPSLESSWFLWGTIFGIGFALTPLKMSYPKMPSQSDVDADVALRKAFNMDSSVNESQDRD
ncbi:hypothetical protein OH460_08305 [Vibrio sp. Makdt]|uniref:hypothetical protein n=1 Tax=Vibrio sp. Makdt TaxID=2998828 RepID=UPI0022CDB24D|nr:hypothetical protein [Vibrio sp. Makdt]MDA0152301.1 hypothetical protein [Vibrio sp. Makdt]